MSSQSTDLAEEFAAASEQSIADPDERERVACALRHALAEARLRYPAVQVSDADFARFIGERLRGTEATGASIALRATSDLYLACGCIAGQAAALSTLDSQVLSSLPSAM